MKNALWLGLALIPSVALAGNADQKQEKKGDGLVCRDVAQTGSRLSSTRVCMSREQWEATRREARQLTEQAQLRQTNPSGH
jgi:nicotinamide mononucleotide (NMN) deamidase PncC